MEPDKGMHDPLRLFPSLPDQKVILLVDDEPTLLITAKIALERAGYFILSAADGEQALFAARNYPGTIHLLLTDIVMPGLDGLALRRRMMEERPATRVLLMS